MIHASLFFFIPSCSNELNSCKIYKGKPWRGANKQQANNSLFFDGIRLSEGFIWVNISTQGFGTIHFFAVSTEAHLKAEVETELEAVTLVSSMFVFSKTSVSAYLDKILSLLCDENLFCWGFALGFFLLTVCTGVMMSELDFNIKASVAFFCTRVLNSCTPFLTFLGIMIFLPLLENFIGHFDFFATLSPLPWNPQKALRVYPH